MGTPIHHLAFKRMRDAVRVVCTWGLQSTIWPCQSMRGTCNSLLYLLNLHYINLAGSFPIGEPKAYGRISTDTYSAWLTNSGKEPSHTFPCCGGQQGQRVKTTRAYWIMFLGRRFIYFQRATQVTPLVTRVANRAIMAESVLTLKCTAHSQP